MSVVIKGYSFAEILYPDSVVDGWIDRIKSTHVKCLVSPKHSPEPESEREKKQHWHVMLIFDSQTSLRQAIDCMSFIAGYECKYVELIRSTHGYARYLCHLDDPDKEQFDITDVKEFNGAKYDKIIDDDETFIKNLEDMTDYIVTHPGISFHNFTTYARYNNREWFRIISCRSTLYLRTLINSIIEERRDIEKARKEAAN